MFSKHQSCHYERRKVISFFIITAILFLSLTQLSHAQSWTQLIANGNTLSAPTEREEHTAVYDATNNRMTIFGGTGSGNPGIYNDVWVLSTANGLGGTPAWTKLSTTPDPTYGLPTARYGHTAVYDPTSNRMTIFGGYNGSTTLGDVWVLSHANGLGGTPAWTQLSPTGSAPTTRFLHSAIYDSANNRMTIFGGFNNSTYLNDVWVLSNANGLGGTPAWTQLNPLADPLYGFPTGRDGHTAVYDVTNNRMTIFGGFFAGGWLNDVWVLSNANGLGGTPAWTQLIASGNSPSAPTIRWQHTAVYDTTNNRMTIFGGEMCCTPYFLNDVWVLSNTNGLGGTPAWTQLFPTGSLPTTRSGQTAVYDAVNNRMTIFGGIDGILNDVWVLSTANGGSLSASFSTTLLNSYGPLTVDFTDTSVGLEGNSTTWSWTFGDGGTSNLQNPQYVYQSVSAPTIYTIYEIVSTSLDMSTASTAIFVTEPPPSITSLLAPLNNLTTFNNALLFSWSTSTDIVGSSINYILQLGLDSGFTSIVTTINSISSTTQTLSSLANGVIYWHIQATSSFGTTGSAIQQILLFDTTDQRIVTSSETVTFYVGDTIGVYLPVQIFFTSTNTDTVTVTSINTTASNLSTSYYIPRYWIITPAVTASNLTATITFSYTSSDYLNSGVTLESDLVPAWDTTGSGNWSSITSGVTVDTVNHLLTVSGITHFSNWTLGGPHGAIPVELSAFEAIKE